MKIRIICLLVAGIFASLFAASAVHAAFVSSVDIQESENVYRVIFRVKGDLPESVNTKSLPRVKCEFSKLTVSSNLKMPTLPFGIVTRINFRPGSKGFIELQVSDPGAHVEYIVLPTVPVKPGMYRLIFDIIPPVKEELPQPKPIAKISPEKPKPIIPLTPQPIFPEEQAKFVPKKGIPFDEYIYLEAERAFKLQHYKRAWILFSRYITRGNKTHRADALYKKALSFYKMHQREVEKYGFDMIQLFQDALNAFPDHKLSYKFKCLIGITYHKLGITKRAEKLLEELLKNTVPEDAQLCALKEIGKIKLEKELPVEAVPIFSRLLQYKQPPDELADTYYLLGKTLYLAGSYRDALSNLYKSIETDPILYLNHPDVIRTIGNALFGMKRYSLARWALTWYLNLDSNPPHKDMLWAQVAETFFQENKLRLAERLQNKIILEMPDTEGAYVTLLRKAQILERKSKGASAEAEMIYQELSQKNLPMPLREITYFRWALLKRNQGQVDEALKIVNEFINTAPEKTPLDDFLELRALIVKEILNKKFREKKYADILKIYGKYGTELDLDNSLLKILAVSFEHLKIYDKALECCEKLIQHSQKIDSSWYYKAAVLAYSLGNLSKAKYYASKIESEKLQVKKLSILGKIATEERNYDRAIKIFEKLFTLEKPPKKDVAFSYVKCLQKAGREEEIVKFLKNFLGKSKELTGQDRFELTKTLMQSLERLGRFNEALAVANKVIELAPDEDSRCQTLYIMAKLYEKQKNQKQVELCLQKMLSCKDNFWNRLAKGELNFLKFKKEIFQNP